MFRIDKDDNSIKPLKARSFLGGGSHSDNPFERILTVWMAGGQCFLAFMPIS